MRGLENLNKRLKYYGNTAEERFQTDKLRTLRKALLYSYQAATAVLQDGREFRCLINSNKLKSDYDAKVISIPYEDICLNSPKNGKTSEGMVPIGMKSGDVFKWKETNTYWIVCLEHYEEDAYFRAEIYRCDGEVEIGQNKYRAYIRGPVETTIQWNLKKNVVWNDLNYSLILYITKNEETLNYFHRFTKVKINGKTWEVKVVDPYSAADGILEVCLGEWYTNEFENEEEKEDIPDYDENSIFIEGTTNVRPYEKYIYKIHNIDNGKWEIDNNKKAKILRSDPKEVEIDIISGKSGEFNLIYLIDNNIKASFKIKIKSLI